MAFNWVDYNVVARSLVRQADEASLRSAISRAYYASFCSARNWIRHNRPHVNIPDTGEAHPIVWRHFSISNFREERQVGIWGDRLRIDRRKADYQDVVNNLGIMSTEAVENSSRLLRSLQDADPD